MVDLFLEVKRRHHWHWKVHLLSAWFSWKCLVDLLGWSRWVSICFHCVLVQRNAGNEPGPRYPFRQMLHEVGKEVRQSSVRYTLCILDCNWKACGRYSGLFGKTDAVMEVADLHALYKADNGQVYKAENRLALLYQDPVMTLLMQEFSIPPKIGLQNHPDLGCWDGFLATKRCLWEFYVCSMIANFMCNTYDTYVCINVRMYISWTRKPGRSLFLQKQIMFGAKSLLVLCWWL